MQGRTLSRAALGLASLAAASICATAQADSISPGLYQLHNHPDGSAASPYYGLRLDELFNLTGGNDVFTFDFDAVGAAMYMTVSATTVHIYGTAFGGLDTGSGYHSLFSGMVNIDFTYSNVTGVAGDDDRHVTGPNFANYGTISMVNQPWISKTLHDYAAGNGYTFRLGDENDDQGHRDYDGISGWGWLTYGTQSDCPPTAGWLFTAQVVPLPPAVLLGGAGLLGVAVLRRRRRGAVEQA